MQVLHAIKKTWICCLFSNWVKHFGYFWSLNHLSKNRKCKHLKYLPNHKKSISPFSLLRNFQVLIDFFKYTHNNSTLRWVLRNEKLYNFPTYIDRNVSMMFHQFSKRSHLVAAINVDLEKEILNFWSATIPTTLHNQIN